MTFHTGTDGHPFAQLLAWRDKRPTRDISLYTDGRVWTCHMWERRVEVGAGFGRTHAVAILNALKDALKNYGEPGADAGGAR